VASVPFRVSYETAFAAHLADTSEGSLRAAYELGREAVQDGLTLLDLAEAHHAALAAAIRRTESDAADVISAAADFLAESISAYEMVRRGFQESHEAALVERSRLDMVRQLSHFLADASLASEAGGSLQELLRLIAEHAREVVDAELCVVTLGGAPSLRASSYGRATDQSRTHATEPLSVVEAPGAYKDDDRLAVPLTSLDGGELGRLELCGKNGGVFSDVDRAAADHLAQLTSAAVERVLLHRHAASR
jgi:hypothetical protein